MNSHEKCNFIDNQKVNKFSRPEPEQLRQIFDLNLLMLFFKIFVFRTEHFSAEKIGLKDFRSNKISAEKLFGGKMFRPKTISVEKLFGRFFGRGFISSNFGPMFCFCWPFFHRPLSPLSTMCDQCH